MQTQFALRVFTDHPEGGNPCLVSLKAGALSDAEMQAIALDFGHECAFVFEGNPKTGCDFYLRYFLPLEETEMCGHATLAALWALRDKGEISSGQYRIGTKSGVVLAKIGVDGSLAISQPEVKCEILDSTRKSLVLSCLGITKNALAQGEIKNASTSRMKTLIHLKSKAVLDGLSPDFDRMKEICTDIGSTGLYPFCPSRQENVFHARQFPRSAGYPEDAATGIAASALAGVLKKEGAVNADKRIIILQGEAMGSPSRLEVDFMDLPEEGVGCWILGHCLEIKDV